MHSTRYRKHTVFIQQWLIGLAMMVLGITTVPSVVFGQPSPDPTGKALDKVPDASEFPVDISIDIVRGDADTLPTVKIDLFNQKSDAVVHLELPNSNVASDHPSGQVTAPPVDTPFDAPPAVTPPLDVHVADLPPIDPPTVEAPSVDTLPVSLPPTPGRP